MSSRFTILFRQALHILTILGLLSAGLPLPGAQAETLPPASSLPLPTAAETATEPALDGAPDARTPAELRAGNMTNAGS